MERTVPVEGVWNSDVQRYVQAEGALQFGICRVDLAAHRAFVNDSEVVLTAQEYALLETLVRQRDTALSRDKLLAMAWGYNYGGDTRTVDVHIQKLRRKLHLEKQIQTIYKLGYKLSTDG